MVHLYRLELCSKFNSMLKNLFERLARSIERNTGYYIIVPLLLTCILANGFQRVVYEDNPEYLFSPTNGPARRERAIVESFFTTNITVDFNRAASVNHLRYVRLLATPKNGGEIFSREIWNDIIDADRKIQNISINYSGRNYQYKDICDMKGTSCRIDDLFKLEKLFEKKNKESISFPIWDNIYLPAIFGGVTLNEAKNVLETAEAIALNYNMDNKNGNDDDIAGLLEEEIKRMVLNTDFGLMRVTVLTSTSLRDGLEDNTISVIPFVFLTVIVMLWFCIFAISREDCVRSKPLIGVSGILCVGLSCVAAFGLLAFIGIPFIGINLFAPFLIIGIGIDATFVFVGVWWETSPKISVADRLAHTYRDAGVAITNPYFTSMMCAFTGYSTPIPSVQIFSLYTGTAILMTYLFHIFMFGALLAAAGHLEERQGHNILCCYRVKSKSQSREKGLLYNLFCAGGINSSEPDHEMDNKPQFLMHFVGEKLGAILQNKIFNCLIVLAKIIIFTIAIYGWFNIKEGLEMKNLSRYDSHVNTYFEMNEEYFRMYPYRVQMVITGEEEYHSFDVLFRISDLRSRVEALPHIDSSGTEAIDPLLLNLTDEDGFVQSIKDTLSSNPDKVYNSDIKFTEDGNRIEAFRLMFQVYNMTDYNDDRLLVEDLREIAKTADMNITFYNPFFIFFDQFTVVWSVTLKTVVAAAVISLISSFVFNPSFVCALLVAFSIFSIMFEVLGFMAHWGVNLDSISMILLIMCTGFSVDASVHIAYAYISAKSKTPSEKVKESLYRLGLPIVEGGISTILGVFVLLFAPSYIYVTFFKIVFLVISFSVFHALLLLPILLKLFGSLSDSKFNIFASKSDVNEDCWIEMKETVNPEISETKVGYIPWAIQTKVLSNTVNDLSDSGNNLEDQHKNEELVILPQNSPEIMNINEFKKQSIEDADDVKPNHNAASDSTEFHSLTSSENLSMVDNSVDNCDNRVEGVPTSDKSDSEDPEENGTRQDEVNLDTSNSCNRYFNWNDYFRYYYGYAYPYDFRFSHFAYMTNMYSYFTGSEFDASSWTDSIRASGNYDI